MANIVHGFINAKSELFRYFKCSGDYFVQSKLGFNWEIKEDDGVFFLSYWENISQRTTAVVTKKDEEPLIFESGDYTMVIAIDCVKIAFIFNNVLKNSDVKI